MSQKLRGFSLIVAGSSNTVFMGCGALGSLAGGFLADRVDRRKVIVASFILAIPALVAFLCWKGPISYCILSLLGFLLLLSEPSCIVLAQELVPEQARTASGMVMGMAWGLAGLGVLGTGALADTVGIEGALKCLKMPPPIADRRVDIIFFSTQEMRNKPPHAKVKHSDTASKNRVSSF